VSSIIMLQTVMHSTNLKNRTANAVQAAVNNYEEKCLLLHGKGRSIQIECS